jgi:hypothetical protein
MPAPVIRPRLLHLVLLLLACAAVVGCGLSAATGTQAAEPAVVLDTADRVDGPTARAYLVAQP